MPVDDIILSLELSPAEKVALLHLRRRSIGERMHARTADLTEVLGYGPSRVKQIVAALIDKGLIRRVARGIYAFGEKLVAVLGGHSSGLEGHSSGLSWSVYKPCDCLATATEVATQPLVGAPPEMSESPEKGTAVGRYDYETEGDDLAAPGLLETDPSPAERRKKAARKRRVPAAHRSVDRSEWTMEFVAKEFRKRCSELNPVTIETWRERAAINPTDGNTMTRVLKAWQVQYRITPQEAADLLDQYFADSRETDKIDASVPAYKRFMTYLKTHIDQHRASVVTDHDLDRVRAQVITWD